MKNRRVKQMMIDVENAKCGMSGYKTALELGWHGFSQAGLFYCSGSNFLWVYEDCIVSVPSNELQG